MKHDLDQIRWAYTHQRRDTMVRMSIPGNGYGDKEPYGTWLRFNGDCTREVVA